MESNICSARNSSSVKPRLSKCQDILSTASFAIMNGLESAFYRYGVAIARQPFLFILLCLIFTSLSSIGFMKFKSDESEQQFMSTKSQFRHIVDWKKEREKFQYATHRQVIIFEAEDVLNKYVLLEILQIRQKVLNMSVDNSTWEDLCAKRTIRKHCDDEIPSEYENYCNMQESMEKVCWEDSVLKIWSYNETTLSSRSQEEIMADINNVAASETGFTRSLGKPDKNGTSGEIRGAKATAHTLYTDASKGQWKKSWKWEQEFISTLDRISKVAENVSVFYITSSSYGKIVREGITGDLWYLFAGFILVFFYVTVMLGRFNLVEQRPILSLLGLTCVGMSLVVSYGLCSACSIPFGAINNILPFLLLGLGIDDMFVIMTAWNNIPQEDRKKELSERIGITMKHAGVSITITSLTDFLAFAIGSFSVLPALRSFCLYSAIGIASVYFFQATFFVACLSLDQRRLESNRQGCVWCWKLKNWFPNQCSQIDFCKTFFEKIYATFLFQLPAKVSIILFTGLLFCISCWGVSNLRTEFDSKWFLPPSSSLAKYLDKSSLYYPPSRDLGHVYFGNISYLKWEKTKNLVDHMRKSKYIFSVDSWYEKLGKYSLKQNSNASIIYETENQFLGNLSNFLYTCEGSRYLKSDFRFDRKVNCSVDLPLITASSIRYLHKILKTTEEKMSAIKDIRAIVDKMGFDGFVFPFTHVYINWETNYIIGKELLQNIGLALLMVFLVTLLLLGSLPLSLMVMLCVLATLVDVGALMHWWGLTIDTISAIVLVLATGLSVDYAVHVAYTFMTVDGTRDERAKATVGIIGPAVLNGGFSTFLSFILLANSESYVFQTFFKIFFALSLYGLYHGLVFLPIMLSLLGPAPYDTVRPSSRIPTTQGNQPVLPTVLSAMEPTPPISGNPSPFRVTSPEDLSNRHSARPYAMGFPEQEAVPYLPIASPSPDLSLRLQVLNAETVSSNARNKLSEP